MFSLTRIGTTIEWYIDNLVLQPGDNSANKYQLFSVRSQQTPPGANGLYINPWQDISSLQERVTRLKTTHSSEEIARAVMEGAAFEMKRKIQKLAEAGMLAERIAMAGGPAESPVWPRIVAEITGLELRLINGQSAGAVGAAILAGIGAGIFRDEWEAFAGMKENATYISPSVSARSRYALLYEEYLKNDS
jgi:sugar (pentulose or hexulose) kinase